MTKKAAIVTGSNGLIGSQTVSFLIEKGYYVVGLDNDMRSYFFGSDASTADNQNSMVREFDGEYNPLDIDIRDYEMLEHVFESLKDQMDDGEIDLDMIVHTAAQPSHDWAANEPLTDFSVNAIGTVNLLELTRLFFPKASFIFTSTNKVYGDRPNISHYTGAPDIDYAGLTIKEEPTRYEGYFVEQENLASVDETMSIDNCKHSLFGASKVAADVMVQEYGRYFGMNTVVFRGGCLTGPNHAGAELHGFLSYLMKCIVTGKPYTIFGYKGKQVRDNIHSWDLVNMFWHYHQKPIPGAVYNAGGGRDNSTSILEAIDTANRLMKEKAIDWQDWKNYTVSNDARIGDHIWYISDLSAFQNDYPEWPGITISLEETISQILDKAIENNLPVSENETTA